MGARKPWELRTKSWFLPHHRYSTGENGTRLGAAAKFNHHRRQNRHRIQQCTYDQCAWVSRIEILEEASRGMGGRSWGKSSSSIPNPSFIQVLQVSPLFLGSGDPTLSLTGQWDGLARERAPTYPEFDTYMNLNILFWQATSTPKQQLIVVEHDFF